MRKEVNINNTTIKTRQYFKDIGDQDKESFKKKWKWN